MCDPVLIVAILFRLSSQFDVLSIDSTVAIPSLSLQGLGYLDDKTEKDNKREISDKEGNKDSLQGSGKEDQKEK